jgi:hypothetical protein
LAKARFGECTRPSEIRELRLDDDLRATTSDKTIKTNEHDTTGKDAAL